MVLTAGFLLVLLIVVGFGIDSAKIARDRATLQRAVDLAAIKGISEGANYDQVARDTVINTLEAAGLSAGFDTSLIQVTPFPTATNVRELTVTSPLNTDLYLIDILPEFLGGVDLNATATTRDHNIAILVLLDASSTMSNLYSYVDPVSGLTMQKAKILGVVDALHDLIDYLDPSSDYLSIVRYGTNAGVYHPFFPHTASWPSGVTGSFDSDLNTGLKSKLTADFTVASVQNQSTNLPKALVKANQELGSTVLANFNDPIYDKKMVVIVSDGGTNVWGWSEINENIQDLVAIPPEPGPVVVGDGIVNGGQDCLDELNAKFATEALPSGLRSSRWSNGCGLSNFSRCSL